MRVYDASTCTSAEFGGIRDLSRHLSLNLSLMSMKLAAMTASVLFLMSHLPVQEGSRGAKII